MQFLRCVLLLLVLAALGCDASQADRSPAATTVADQPSAPVAAPASGEAAAAEVAAPTEAATAATPVPVDGGAVALAPENTKIEFVGVHLPPKQPDPRTGGFEKFSGKLEVDAAAKAVKSIHVEIDTTSLWTQIGGRLTTHLKSADFLEVEEFPTIKFESTKIEPGKGDCQITGRLTLHGATKEIQFPAQVEITESGLVLKTKFDIDRAEFGMTKMLEGVGNKVSLTVVVGEKNQPRQSEGKGGGKGKRGKPA